MYSFFKLKLILIYLSASFSIFAGDETAFGGDAIVFFSDIRTKMYVEKQLKENPTIDPFDIEILPQIENVILLDIYERMQNSQAIIESSEISYTLLLRDLIHEKDGFVNQKFSEIENHSKQYFINYFGYLVDTLPRDVDDAEILFRLPRNALKVQIAIQKNTRFYIYRPLFRKMDIINQAALLFHEWTHAWTRDLVSRSNSEIEIDSAFVRTVASSIFLKEFHPVLLQKELQGFPTVLTDPFFK